MRCRALTAEVSRRTALDEKVVLRGSGGQIHARRSHGAATAGLNVKSKEPGERFQHRPVHLASGRWQCVCGRRHRGYVTQCQCGVEKRMRMPRWHCVCGRRHRDYITRCTCGLVRDTEAQIPPGPPTQLKMATSQTSRMMSKQDRLQAAQAEARERAEKRAVAKVRLLVGQPVAAPPERSRDLTSQHRDHHHGEFPDQCAQCRRESALKSPV